MRARPSLRRLSSLFVLAALGVALSCGEIRADELLCEEAVVRLVDCCPGFDARRVNCVYVSGCSGTTRPNFSEGTSECIRGRSCDALRDRGTCARVSAIEPDAIRGEGSRFDREVCP